MASAEDMARAMSEMNELKAKLLQSEQHSAQIAAAHDNLRQNTDIAIQQLQGQLTALIGREAKNRESPEKDLVDLKARQPEGFDGKKSYKAWAKSMKAFLNASKNCWLQKGIGMGGEGNQPH